MVLVSIYFVFIFVCERGLIMLHFPGLRFTNRIKIPKMRIQNILYGISHEVGVRNEASPLDIIKL